MGSVRHLEGRRRALVIGISRTPALEQDEHLARRFPPLDCVPQDVDLVGKALRHSKYEVEQLLNLGGNDLLGRLREFLSSCRPGDMAFVYLSCHGETVNGRDHLLPMDAQPGAELPDGGRSLFDRTLIPADPDGLLSGLLPGCTAVICLDTCRVTAEQEPGSEQQRRTLLSRAEDVYWLHSCARGELSYADPREGSWFGRVLAEALEPTSPPTTFPEVVDHVRVGVRRLASTAGVAPPTIEPYAPHGRSADAQDGPELCDGSQEALRWTTMIENSALWNRTSGTAAVHRRVKDQLGLLVEHVVGTLSGAGAHRDDPWTDPTWPVRMVDRLGNLVERASLSRRELLSPAETAALLAAPVVHEGVVALALDELRRVLPERMDTDTEEPDHADPDDHVGQVRGASQDVCRAHSHARRTAETLRRRGLVEQAFAADHWLRHRFIADWDPLWEGTGSYPAVDHMLGLVVDAVLAATETPAGKAPSEAARHTIDRQLRQVLPHVTVPPSDSPRINDPRHGDDWDPYPPVPGNEWRGPDLARLLWISGLLAADPRRMSGVLVDHLGAHEQLVPREVVAALSADFEYDDMSAGGADETYCLAVRFPCPHPALHVAVEVLVDRADSGIAAMRAEWRKHRTSAPALLSGLPERVTTDQLVPLDRRYKQPLERFRLAEDEIRPLLMGAQLYGDPMLAVRELYQNALDACRHRGMRRRYGMARGHHDPDWRPTITFKQSWDEEGRPYIECTDNGSGMTRAKLTSMFARAGRRYEQDPEFVQERRNWRRAGLPEMPLNSRFGIGVFSYFMLAEEVVVWTSPVNRFGRAQPHTLQADIQSGSGLLRIGDAPKVSLDGGTRVRLYLSADDTVLPSLLETLESQIWVSDCTVVATEHARDDPGHASRPVIWQPGELKAARKDWHGDPVRAGKDAWLVQGRGQVLLDGVVVKDAPKVYGYIVNLQERHRPEPSVDRNKMLSYERELVMRELLNAVPEACARCDDVSLNWLWQLTDDEPRLAVAVLDALPDHTTAWLEAPTHMPPFPPRRLTLSTVGCLPIDKSTLDWGSSSLQLDVEKDTHQNDALAQWQETRLAARSVAAPFTPRSYPAPTSLDALLFRNDVPSGWAAALGAAHLGRTSVGQVVRAWRRYAVVGLPVPATDDIRSLRDLQPDKAMIDLCSGYASISSVQGPNPPAAHAPLLDLSATHQITLGEAAALLERLRALDPDLPPPPELGPHLASERATRADQFTLIGTDDFPRYGTRLPGVVHPVDLLSRVDHHSLDEAVDRIRHFSPLGWSLAAEPTPAAREMGELSRPERLLLSNGLGDFAPWVEGHIPLLHVVRLANESDTPLKTLIEQIKDTAPATQVVAPEFPPEAAQWIPSASYKLINALSDEEVDRPGPWACVFLLTDPGDYRLRSATAEQTRKDLNMLAVCGLLAPGAAERIDDVVRQMAMTNSLLFHSNKIDGSLLDMDGLHTVHVLATSASTRLPLGEVYDRMEREEHHLPLKLPEQIPEEARSLQPTYSDLYALTVDGSTFSASVSILDVLEHADAEGRTVGGSHRRLKRFTVLGASAPPGELSGPDGEFLDTFEPEVFDLAAFEAEVLLGRGILGPLELVLTAGRFGWTLGRTYDRYAPFRCLGLDVRVDAPNATEAPLAPDWRDVIILTRQLTGRAPALSGRVDPDHLVLCAEETDLTEGQVRERVAGYARLFSLVLPPDEEPDEEDEATA
ncbi:MULTISPECIES: caspase family protein [unclassified Streptomyces]|uniref:HD domain-containing protein n=1 Tax=unclassified Streptomyces TaxID=2593676 RepID=UPI002366273D|nr:MULTISPECIES: caspase family protein [unclassified Streptomyces]MDF3141618.1 caspase family protein [Streptomyces sp. T21Q-yed]WDF37379.1 caspase family protein [Streptomyces sp. T12]